MARPTKPDEKKKQEQMTFAVQVEQKDRFQAACEMDDVPMSRVLSDFITEQGDAAEKRDAKGFKKALTEVKKARAARLRG